MEELEYECETCGLEHDGQRVLDIRKIIANKHMPSHWRVQCNICKKIAVIRNSQEELDFCYDGQTYKNKKMGYTTKNA